MVKTKLGIAGIFICLRCQLPFYTKSSTSFRNKHLGITIMICDACVEELRVKPQRIISTEAFLNNKEEHNNG